MTKNEAPPPITTNKTERSLLLYLESRAVDYQGRVDQRSLNKEDFEIAQRWSAEGKIGFGRIAHDYMSYRGAYWVRLTLEATQEAHRLRAERAERAWDGKTYRTTAEKRGETSDHADPCTRTDPDHPEYPHVF